MSKNKRYHRYFRNESYHNNNPVSHLGVNNVDRELGVQCRRCTRILTYSHPKPGDLCPICRRVDRNSKIRRGKRQQLASNVESSSRISPLNTSYSNKRHENIFQNNISPPQERFATTQIWERRIYPTPSFFIEEDPNYFSFESRDRNGILKFDNDMQISSQSVQGHRTVQVKSRENNQSKNAFQQPFENYHFSNEERISSNSTTPIVHHVRGVKRKAKFEDVSLKRSRSTIPDSPVPVDYELTGSIWQYYTENVQTDEIFNAKMELRDRLECIIQEKFPGSELFVFGSSMTGYGTKTCDVDMCLMFHGLEVNKKNTVNILWELRRLFSRKYFLIKLQVIRARVSILKFKDSLSGFDVDLNINNPIGIRNSQLLRSYARIDERVRPLILSIKLWARSHDINDARTSTLSSYCLGLMLIHYLQYRCSPPVLPCLQTLQPDKYLTTTDVRTLKVNEDLPLFSSSNNQSLGSLFAGFIHYYSREYDYCASRISVRLGCLLRRVEKRRKKNVLVNWIDIEEPFEQTNAARSANSPKVYDYIKTVFDRTCCSLNQCGDIYSLCNYRT